MLNKHTIERQFEVGDKVMRKVHTTALAPGVNRTLLGKYKGPYTVKKVNDFSLDLICDETLKSCTDHKSYCKKVYPKDEDMDVPDSFMDEIDKLTKNAHSMTTRSKAKQ